MQTLLDIFSSMKQGCATAPTDSRQFRRFLVGFDRALAAHGVSYMSECKEKQLESDLPT
ncbi:hypothetical protein [Paraburkholderia diazotrophica]|uniref:hypothetical protein n=1 Tax=Paraburkholderia diazotrophica TaxID=667676 RepID=UPI003178CFEE